MRVESELGPLWDSEPKVFGFRLAIPDPMELYNWAISQARAHGDTTQEQINSEFNEHLKDFVVGRSKRFMPSVREWEVDINYLLFKRINIEFDAAYSPKSGEWASILANLDYSYPAIRSGWHYAMAARTPQIADRLVEKGFREAYAIQTKDNIQMVVVPGPTRESTISIATGYLSREAAATLDPEDDPDEIAQLGILVRPEKTLPLNLTDMFKSLQTFQHVLSHAVDALYEVMPARVDPPNVKLVLSAEYELS